MLPTEAQEAATLVAYLRVRGFKFTHVANETGGTPEAKRRAIRVKREGTSRGFPDYVVIVNNTLVFIELKRRSGSRISPEQVEWIKALQDAGAVAQICKGAGEAITLIENIKSRRG